MYHEGPGTVEFDGPNGDRFSGSEAGTSKRMIGPLFVTAETLDGIGSRVARCPRNFGQNHGAANQPTAPTRAR
jgi:hypothetical protein